MHNYYMHYDILYYILTNTIILHQSRNNNGSYNGVINYSITFLHNNQSIEPTFHCLVIKLILEILLTDAHVQ